MKKLFASCLAGLALLAMNAQATPSFIIAEQGVLFGFNQIDPNSFTLRIKGALDATGDWGPATTLANLGFKNLGFDPTGGTLSPGNWSWSPNELNANGCAGGDSGGVCFDAAPPITLTNDMTFQIDLTGGVLNLSQFDTPHLKLMFLNATGSKQGSLLSQDMTYIVPGTPDPFDFPPGTVPEPASLALVGLGLVGIGLVRRRTL